MASTRASLLHFRIVSNRRRMSRVRIAIAVAASLVAIVAVASCGGGRAVPAVVVDAAPFAAEISARGRLEAGAIAAVAAEGAGRVIDVLVKAGASVTVGDPLVRLDADMATEQYRSAVAAAAAATDGVRSARADLAGAEVQLAERRRDHERLEPLAGTAVPAADVETARSAVVKAEADVERALARLAQSEAQAAAAAADRDAVRRVRDNLVLRAPLSGVVVSRDVDPGAVVGAGTPLLRLADPTTLEVVAYLDETAMSRLRVGLAARVSFLSAAEPSVNGTVTSIGREVDPDTREVEVRIALTSVPSQWALGQRVDVRVDTDPATASAAVPSELVSWQNGTPGVYVARQGRARWRPVELGHADGTRIELARGVQAGDTVLAPAGLQADTRVAPVIRVALEQP
jgi:HlyD family secretion protein